MNLQSESMEEKLKNDDSGVYLENLKSQFEKDILTLNYDIETGLEPVRFRKAQALKNGLFSAAVIVNHVWNNFHN